MTSRFVSNVTVLLAGAFLVSASFAFDAETTGWLALAVGCLTTLTVLGAFALRGRGTPQRAFDVCVLVTALWTVVASRVFAGAELKWLSFASGAVMALLSFAGLIVHEVLMEMALARRVEHAAEDHLAQAPDRPALGAVR
jgi:hypothetical protein